MKNDRISSLNEAITSRSEAQVIQLRILQLREHDALQVLEELLTTEGVIHDVGKCREAIVKLLGSNRTGQ